MKKLSQTVLFFAIAFLVNYSAAQTFTPPNNLPVKPVNKTPTKFYVAKPDLQAVSASLISIESMPDPNLIKIKLSVTYKNAGTAASGRNFDLGLLGFHAASTGGATNIDSYEIAIDYERQPLAGGQSRTEEWSFIKDKTKMNKGSNQCMIIVDYGERIAESDETNNKSTLFTIIIP